MNILKFICHCCKRSAGSEYTVPCKTAGCNLFFCHRCLTSRYKYSYAKTAKLPTPHWKCPVCTKKCSCADCPSPSQSEVPAFEGKLMVQGRTSVHQHRKKKRIRKGKRKSSDSSLGTGSSLRTPPSERETQGAYSPPPKFPPPPISSNCFL